MREAFPFGADDGAEKLAVTTEGAGRGLEFNMSDSGIRGGRGSAFGVSGLGVEGTCGAAGSSRKGFTSRSAGIIGAVIWQLGRVSQPTGLQSHPFDSQEVHFSAQLQPDGEQPR